MYQNTAPLKDIEKKIPAKQFKTIAPIVAATTSNTTPASQKNIPPFLNKLYSMVNDPESDDLICWSDDGASFFVNRQEDFARKVLPRFFKHKKFSSFVRQLNMYGFHKVPHLQQGVLETDGESERWEFSNPHFQRNQRDLLLLVNRKKGPNTDEKEISSIDLHHILEEIQSIKKHQTNISTQLQNIQRDNQVLWQETMAARERHVRHQETIDKILRFLASVFSNNDKRNAIPRKRRFLLGPADESDHELELENGNHQNQFQNMATTVSEESGRPTKIPRQADPASSFNIDDYVNGKSDISELSTTLPEHLKNTTSATSSDLDDAIALNDQSKIDHSAIASINDFSNITNIPQLQNLQNLITLAQSNPDLLNQLTNEVFYGSSSDPFSSQTHHPQSQQQQQQQQKQQQQQQRNHQQQLQPQLSLPQQLTQPLQPQPNQSPATYTHNTTTNNNNSPNQNYTHVPSNSIYIPPTSSALNTTQAAQTIDQVTNSISNISHTADALNQDIDDLGISLQQLANHLGFDPSKNVSDTERIDDVADGELLDMDEFLNTYGPDVNSDFTNNQAQNTATITDIPSTATTRSPSPVVSTPGSIASTYTNKNK
ncbi:hypothetical protein BDF21DRAFT_426148 [Thamnidium elegans]|nr:hypothetical protein BDF21DRAFT_426148 [Thamnidium elegans]